MDEGARVEHDRRGTSAARIRIDDAQTDVLRPSGRYRPNVTRCVAFEGVPEALTDLAARRTVGRVVVRVSG